MRQILLFGGAHQKSMSQTDLLLRLPSHRRRQNAEINAKFYYYLWTIKKMGASLKGSAGLKCAAALEINASGKGTSALPQ